MLEIRVVGLGLLIHATCIDSAIDSKADLGKKIDDREIYAYLLSLICSRHGPINKCTNIEMYIGWAESSPLVSTILHLKLRF